MSIQISLELSDSDLTHFRELMNTAVNKAKDLPVESVISKAEALCDEMENANVPDFVKSRLESLKMLIEALRDPDWQLPAEEKSDIVASLAYFSEPHDLVPDNIPGLGYLDDAIMIELVIQDLSLDLQAYESFCSFRQTEKSRRGDDSVVNRENWVQAESSNSRSGMRRKRRLFSR